MANPQKEDGYTAIANEIMDAMCRIRIPGEERQVLDAILRKTYGWNKCEDAIALSQFVDMTGLTKPHIIHAIKGLLLKKVITVAEKGNEAAKVYKFNKNYDEWCPLPKKATLPKKEMRIAEKGNASLPKKGTTKETTTKDTLTKDIYPPEFLTFWKAYPKKVGKDAALKAWKKRNGTRPGIDAIIKAIEEQKRSDQWTRDSGQYIPNPATWINQGRWDDEVETQPKGKWESMTNDADAL